MTETESKDGKLAQVTAQDTPLSCMLYIRPFSAYKVLVKNGDKIKLEMARLIQENNDYKLYPNVKDVSSEITIKSRREQRNKPKPRGRPAASAASRGWRASSLPPCPADGRLTG